MRPSLVLIDASFFLHRGYFALPTATNSHGENIGAVRAAFTMLTMTMDSFPTCPHFVAVFDPPGKNFRHEIYPNYKAQRPPKAEAMLNQLPLLKELFELCGIPCVRVDGYEADDVIGTMAAIASKDDMDVIIATSDKDMAQLVNKKVNLYSPVTNITLDYEGVVRKYNVFPEEVIDWLTLCGDSADNVPGVEGVGVTTAARLLDLYGSVEGVYENLSMVADSDIRGARTLVDKLEAHREFIPTGKALVTIKTDVPEVISGGIPFTPKNRNSEELVKFLLRYELNV